MIIVFLSELLSSAKSCLLLKHSLTAHTHTLPTGNGKVTSSTAHGTVMENINCHLHTATTHLAQRVQLGVTPFNISFNIVSKTVLQEAVTANVRKKTLLNTKHTAQGSKHKMLQYRGRDKDRLVFSFC